MIATSIALAFWTAWLSWLTHKDDKRRAQVSTAEAPRAIDAADEKACERDGTTRHV